MHTENEVLIRARVGEIYGLAAPVERWPELLPHYRFVRVLETEGSRRLVEMAASRDGIPVRWTAEQECFPDEPRMTFRHVRGPTTGMEVEWTFEGRADGPVRVRISHDLDLGWPLLGGFVARRVIGPLFISNIANKTLRRIKEVAEARTTISGETRA